MSVSDLANETLASVLGLREKVKSGGAEDVIADTREVERLMEHPGWSVLVGLLKEREDRELKQVMTRPASDNGAEYAKFIGFLQGLRALEPTARAIAEYGKKLENDEKEREVAGNAA